MGFDISETLAPQSDQLDAVDLLGGARTFTITDVSKGNDEQPVQVHLAEFPRVWRPGKSMRRVLAAAWGSDASTWTGRKVELYCDPAVMFGGQAVGGTRIARMSHIDKALKVPLLVKRGKSAIFTVQPLPADAVTQTRTPDLKALAAAFKAAGFTDKAAMLTFAVDVAGRDLASAGDLTADEVDRVVAALRDKMLNGEGLAAEALDVPTEEPPAVTE